MTRALITGITGMDGSHLADLLYEKGYEVHGLVRRRSWPDNLGRIEHLGSRVQLHAGDLLDQSSLSWVVARVEPDEVYNLAAQSFVGTSWTQPELTAQVTGLGTLRVLEAVRRHAPGARVYQASSSEMFGDSRLAIQDERTPFRPRSPYGAAKVYAHNIAVNYRESYGLWIACGILFNHESERRSPEFVTRKISRQAAEIAAGQREAFSLGNLAAVRDWGYAPDYVEGMWRMLRHSEPDDFVLATNETRTVGDFVEAAAYAAGLDRYEVERDEAMIRPAELNVLCGSPRKARALLGWQPRTPFRDWVRRMVDADRAALAGIVPA